MIPKRWGQRGKGHIGWASLGPVFLDGTCSGQVARALKGGEWLTLRPVLMGWGWGGGNACRSEARRKILLWDSENKGPCRHMNCPFRVDSLEKKPLFPVDVGGYPASCQPLLEPRPRCSAQDTTCTFRSGNHYRMGQSFGCSTPKRAFIQVMCVPLLSDAPASPTGEAWAAPWAHTLGLLENGTGRGGNK